MSEERMREFIATYIEDEYVNAGGDSIGKEIYRDLVWMYKLTPEEIKWLGLDWLKGE